MTTESIADLHERLGRLLADPTGMVARPDPKAGGKWDASRSYCRGLEVDDHVRELSYAARAELANWKAQTPTERRAALEAEWTDRDAALEHARVKYGRGSPRYRAAVRAIGYVEPLAGQVRS